MEVESQPAAVVEELLHKKTLLYCKQLIGTILKMSSHQIDSSESFENFGIDSIIIGQINARLKESFNDISNTILFECQTIDSLAEHLIQTHRETLRSLFELDQQPGMEMAAPVNVPYQLPKINLRPAGRRSRRLRVINNPKLSERAVSSRNSIAIIGISGMYPQAPSLEAYWENLKSGKNCTSEIPADRWPQDDFYEADERKAVEQGKSYSKWGGFIDRFSEFDASFFGISPLEAMCIDPQERLFLQTAWQALESAGYTRTTLKNKYKQKVGVFVGITKLGFNLYGSSRTIRENKFFPRTSFGSVANRLSYFMDITGPSMPVDTMCSSSLTAIHEACEHIHRGECNLAFAGGVNLYLHPSSYIDLSAQGMLARDNRCKSFGAGADGFVPGEGVGVVLLKPLANAVEDNDTIHGIILATHVNHGGRSNGYTLPNPRGQTELIRQAMEKAGIGARDISYIEAHGTGTELGDSIEISVLKQAFAADSQDSGYCKIGSVKSNIGHCESAAGISALTKVILQLKHRQIAPSLHSTHLNPHLDLDKSPFVLNRSLTAWEQPVIDGRQKPRIAGISSFGAGGANAHIIIQEYLPPADVKQPTAAGLSNTGVAILLSARTEEQLQQKARDLLDFIRVSKHESQMEEASVKSPEPIDLPAMAYTLQVGREAMEERLGFLVNSVEQLAAKLQAYMDGGQDIEGICRGQVKNNKDTLSLFNSDSDLQETIDKWIAHKKLSSLLNLWVKGLDLDWSRLYEENRFKPQRLSLPTYPFARARYWIDTLNLSSAQFETSGGPLSGTVGHSSTGNGRSKPATQVWWRFSRERESTTNGEAKLTSSMGALEKTDLFLKQEIALQLQIPLKDVAVDKNFFELGINSLGITDLIHKINDLLEENIVPSVLFEYPSIQKLGEYLLITYPEKIDSIVIAQEKQKTNIDIQRKNGILVAMQPEGNKPPIFAVPGGTGNVLALLPLSQALGNNQPFYGLQPRGLDGETPPLDSMERVVRENIATLQTVQPEGPYTLMGYSNGGVVAYEMVRVLLARGEKIASLILLDSLCPLNRVNDLLEETVEIGNSFMRTLGVNLNLNVKQLRRIPENRRCEYLYDIMSAKGLDISKEQFTSGYSVAKASDHCCRTYKPSKLSQKIDISLYRATEAYPDMPDDYGWNQLLLDPIRTIAIEANHFSIVNEGPVREVADSILASAHR